MYLISVGNVSLVCASVEAAKRWVSHFVSQGQVPEIKLLDGDEFSSVSKIQGG